MTQFINSTVAIIILLILGRSIYLAISSSKVFRVFVSRIVNSNDLENLKHTIENEKLLGTAGKDYLASFKEFDKGSITNINASDYFYIENISATVRSLSLLKLNSSAFVSIGVLGTFLGLALGLARIDIDPLVVDADRLGAQIGELLANVSTAFNTSIFGLIGSLIALFAERLFRSRYEKSQNKLCEFLDSQFLDKNEFHSLIHTESITVGIQSAFSTKINGNDISTSDLIAKFLEHNERQTDALESFSSELAFTIEDLMNKVFNNEESTFRKEFANIASKLTELSESLRSPAEDMTKNVVEELQQSLRVMIEEFQTSISDGARQEMDQLTKQLGQVSSSLTSIPNVLEELQSSTENSIGRINSQMIDSAKLMGEETTQSVDQLSQIIGNLVSEIEEIQERQLSLTASQSDSFDKMSQMTEKFKDTLEDLDSLSEEIAEAGGQVGATADILKRTSISLEKAVDTVGNSNQELNSTLTSFITETSNLIGEQSSLTEHIIQGVEKIKSHSTIIKEQYQELDASISQSFKSIQEGIDSYAMQVKDSNDGFLSDYSKAVNGISNSLAQGADEIRQAMEEISESFDQAILKLKTNEEE